jgi:uncharacterized protein (DUF1810 family)
VSTGDSGRTLSADPYGLQRFVDEQDDGDTYRRALAELRAGHKATHWMWFVFPQIAGLGHSQMAKRYAISSLDEAKAYMRHPVLGERLISCADALLGLETGTAREILGDVDAMKLHSSMTLFALAAPERRQFREVLDRYFGGRADDATVQRL